MQYITMISVSYGVSLTVAWIFDWVSVWQMENQSIPFLHPDIPFERDPHLVYLLSDQDTIQYGFADSWSMFLSPPNPEPFRSKTWIFQAATF
jgi:hypothetical protein